MPFYTKVDSSQPVGRRCSVYEDGRNDPLIVVEGHFTYLGVDYYMQYLPNNANPRKAIVYRAREVIQPDGSPGGWLPVAPELVIGRT